MTYVSQNLCYHNWQTWRWAWVVEKLPEPAYHQSIRILRPGFCGYLKKLRTGSTIRTGINFDAFLERNALFIHVPKAAGNTIAETLFDGRAANHMTAYAYSFAFSEHEFSNMFKFTFVRNPWDRVHSAYQFLCSGGLHRFDAIAGRGIAANFQDFNDFVIRGLSTTEIQNIVHFKPALHFLETSKNKLRLDFIGYFENLQLDLNYVRRQVLPGSRATQIAWENKTLRSGDYRKSYSAKAIEVVANVYRDDIKAFGYDFDKYKPCKLNARTQ